MTANLCCATCGQPLPPDAPAMLCPLCLLAAAVRPRGDKAARAAPEFAMFRDPHGDHVGAVARVPACKPSGACVQDDSADARVIHDRATRNAESAPDPGALHVDHPRRVVRQLVLRFAVRRLRSSRARLLADPPALGHFFRSVCTDSGRLSRDCQTDSRAIALMPNEDHPSVIRWLEGLKAEDELDEVAQQLWKRHFDRLVRLARAAFRTVAWGAAEEQDEVARAVENICRAATQSTLPGISDPDDLWRLVLTMTSQRVIDIKKRGARAQTDPGGIRFDGGSSADGAGCIVQTIVADPVVEYAGRTITEYRRLLELLGDEALCIIVLMKFEGYRNDQIATSLGTSLRSVERKLGVIRKRWCAECGS
jgi:DNA-directed RNA polymerase specialized sigma24 family protein